MAPVLEIGGSLRDRGRGRASELGLHTLKHLSPTTHDSKKQLFDFGSHGVSLSFSSCLIGACMGLVEFGQLAHS